MVTRSQVAKVRASLGVSALFWIARARSASASESSGLVVDCTVKVLDELDMFSMVPNLLSGTIISRSELLCSDLLHWRRLRIGSAPSGFRI